MVKNVTECHKIPSNVKNLEKLKKKKNAPKKVRYT